MELNDRNKCDLCNGEGNQFHFHINCIDRYYCEKCGDMYGKSIFEESRKRIRRLEKEDKYVDELAEIKLIEALHKDNVGDIKISFINRDNYNKHLVNAPILKNGQPIGFITEVNDIYVHGVIWGRYAPLVAERDECNRVIGFELAY